MIIFLPLFLVSTKKNTQSQSPLFDVTTLLPSSLTLLENKLGCFLLAKIFHISKDEWTAPLSTEHYPIGLYYDIKDECYKTIN